jgi:hypothetical protein
MTRFVVVLVALALPALAGAEDIYRWRDANGTLNYSNQPAHVPSDAVVLHTRLDVVHGTPGAVPAVRRAEPREAAPGPARQQQAYRPAWTENVGACGSAYPYFCPGMVVPFGLTATGLDIADQVKEANLLDALHVPWRRGCQ